MKDKPILELEDIYKLQSQIFAVLYEAVYKSINKTHFSVFVTLASCISALV